MKTIYFMDTDLMMDEIETKLGWLIPIPFYDYERRECSTPATEKEIVEACKKCFADISIGVYDGDTGKLLFRNIAEDNYLDSWDHYDADGEI